jgi:hypothetical protein
MIQSIIKIGQQSYLLSTLLIFSIVILNNCGNGSDSDSTLQSTETTSASLKILWHDGVDQQNLGEDKLATAAALDCLAIGVDHVFCQVYDTSGALLATGGPWSCLVGSGRIDDIPSGPDRTFVVLAEDVDNNIRYHGQTSGITIKANEITEGVVVKANPFIPSLQLPDNNARVIVNSFELNWEALQNAYEYRILISENPDLTGLVVNAVTSIPLYEPMDLIPEREYYWVVRAIDQYGNEGQMADVRRFETVPADIEDTVPPTIPVGLTGVATSASQIDISWDGANDDFAVNGYWIYRNGAQLGQTAATSYSDTALIPSTEYCYRVEAFDMAGNTSGQSSPICVTTLDSVVWYRDQDGDGFGDPANSIETSDPGIGYVADNTDCNDQEETIHPGAPEECDDGIDQNCSGSDQVCPPAPEDLDGDGYIEDDCNDNNFNIHPGANELCDGVDNDCDGAVDEGLSRETTCGAGACSNTGAAICSNGRWDDNCEPRPGTAEVCDGVDNNCDGAVDEGLSGETDTTCGVGACRNTGTRRCENGRWSESCVPNEPRAEICDNVDNDCDDAVDEELTRETTCGVGACMRSGTEFCRNGDWLNSCEEGVPGTEICDNVDNDCDGQVDEELSRSETGRPCGVGACMREGTETCINGSWSYSCTPGQPGIENCDNVGVDNDCDGQVNEGFGVEESYGNENCDDGIDNDCDGLTDVDDCGSYGQSD